MFDLSAARMKSREAAGIAPQSRSAVIDKRERAEGGGPKARTLRRGLSRLPSPALAAAHGKIAAGGAIGTVA